MVALAQPAPLESRLWWKRPASHPLGGAPCHQSLPFCDDVYIKYLSLYVKKLISFAGFLNASTMPD